MLAYRCQCGCLQGWFVHPDVTEVVQFNQQWKYVEGQARIMVPPTREQIDVEAYFLWCAAGRPVSDGKEFHHQAVEKLAGGVEKWITSKVGVSALMTWNCPKCGQEHKSDQPNPLYKMEWVGPCSCGKPLGQSPYSYCLDCARKKEKKEKKQS